MSNVYFLAHYEDAAKVAKAAKAEGHKGDESWLDYVDANDSRYSTSKRFDNLEAAVAWVKNAAETNLTVFGLGSVLKIEQVKRRCAYCVCGDGWQRTHKWNVSNYGIEEDFEEDSECYNGEAG